MKRKYLGRMDWLRSTRERVFITEYGSGYASAIFFDDVREKLIRKYTGTGRSDLLADTGYIWTQYLPLNANWCLTTAFDDRRDIVQWYIDITWQNGSENGEPYYDDLYLDIIVFPDGLALTLDRDELEDALRLGATTAEQYAAAIKEVEDMHARIKRDISWLEKISAETLALFESRA